MFREENMRSCVSVFSQKGICMTDMCDVIRTFQFQLYSVILYLADLFTDFIDGNYISTNLLGN